MTIQDSSFASNTLPRRRLGGLLLALGLSAADSTANSAPAKLNEKQTVEIEAPVAHVWAAAGSFADLTWVPAVKSSSATNGNTPGSRRTLDFGGAAVTETLISYDGARRTYTYRLDDTPANIKVVPVRGLTATISVVSLGNGRSTATWEGTFSRVDQSANPAAGLDDETARKQIAGVFTAGLAGLKARAEGRR